MYSPFQYTRIRNMVNNSVQTKHFFLTLVNILRTMNTGRPEVDVLSCVYKNLHVYNRPSCTYALIRSLLLHIWISQVRIQP